MMVLDRQGPILAWNDAATRLYGWSESEALQRDFQDPASYPAQPGAGHA